MFKKFHTNESGQTALETAIILIAFVVVASVFAFAILSAGTASTDRGEAAIYAGLEGVQASMQVRGAVVAQKDATDAEVEFVLFTVALAGDAEPVDLSSTGTRISYRTDAFSDSSLTFTATGIGGADADTLLEPGEMMEIKVTLPTGADALVADTEFTLEVVSQTGGVLNLSRSTPAALSAYMELR